MSIRKKGISRSLLSHTWHPMQLTLRCQTIGHSERASGRQRARWDTERGTMWPMSPWHAAGLRPAVPGLVDASRRRGRAIVALIAAAGSVVLGLAIVQMVRVPITTPLVLLLACTVV